MIRCTGTPTWCRYRKFVIGNGFSEFTNDQHCRFRFHFVPRKKKKSPVYGKSWENGVLTRKLQMSLFERLAFSWAERKNPTSWIRTDSETLGGILFVLFWFDFFFVFFCLFVQIRQVTCWTRSPSVAEFMNERFEMDSNDLYRKLIWSRQIIVFHPTDSPGTKTQNQLPG